MRHALIAGAINVLAAAAIGYSGLAVHRGIRPLTIVVTKDMRGCNAMADELREWLEEREGSNAEQAAEKVLAVSSAPEHQANVSKLRVVDSPASKVEWISVRLDAE